MDLPPGLGPTPHQHFQVVASKIQLFQLDQEGQGPVGKQSMAWRGRRPKTLGHTPAREVMEGHDTHAGKDLSRFSRSSKVTRLARLKKIKMTTVEQERQC